MFIEIYFINLYYRFWYLCNIFSFLYQFILFSSSNHFHRNTSIILFIVTIFCDWFHQIYWSDVLVESGNFNMFCDCCEIMVSQNQLFLRSRNFKYFHKVSPFSKLSLLPLYKNSLVLLNFWKRGPIVFQNFIPQPAE